MSSGRFLALGLILAVAFVLTGCATTPPLDFANYGPYPAEYEAIVEAYVAARAPSSPEMTVTVTSVIEPIRERSDDVAGWAAWGKVRQSRRNGVGGVDIHETEFYFLLRDGRVILSDYAAGK